MRLTVGLWLLVPAFLLTPTAEAELPSMTDAKCPETLEESIDAVVRLSRSRRATDEMRERAARCLEERTVAMGEAAVEPLIHRLSHRNEYVRESVAWALGKLESKATKAVPALMVLLEQKQSWSAAWALSLMGDPRPLGLLAKFAWREESMDFVDQFGAAAIPFLATAMKDSKASPLAFREAVAFIQRLEVGSDEVRPMLSLLDDELNRPGLRTAGGAASAPGFRRSPCEVVGDESTPRAVFFLQMLAHARSAEAKPLYLKAMERGHPELNQAALSALARLKDESVLAELKRRLASEDAQCAAVAAIDLGNYGSTVRDEATRIAELLDARTLVMNREELELALASIGGPIALKRFGEGLGSGHSAMIALSAKALGLMGAEARPALSQLEALARDHWSPLVRHEAARAASRIAGTPIEAASERCGVLVHRDGEHWVAELDGRKVTLLDLTKAPLPLKDCTRAIGGDAPQVNRCAVAKNQGEFGGSIEVTEDGKTVHSHNSGFMRPKWLHWMNDELLVVEGRDHSVMSAGSVVRLCESPGGWCVRQSVELPGAPLGIAVDGNDLILLTTRRDLAPAAVLLKQPICGVRRFGESGPPALVRVMSAGELQLLY